MAYERSQQNRNTRPSQDVQQSLTLRPDTKSMKLATALGMPAEYVQLVMDVTAKGATDEEFCLFLQTVNDTGLNPLLQEIWFYKIYSNADNRKMPIIHCGIKGMRKAADRIGGYSPGRETTYELDADGYLLSATAYVKRKVDGDWNEIAFTAHWEEFAKYDGKNPSGKWATMPKHMLAKVAEFHALQRAFPTLQALADSDNLPAFGFAPTEPEPGEAKAPEPGVDQAEIERRRGIFADALTHMAEIMVEEKQQASLLKWIETATLEDLAGKHNTALVQFCQYAKGVYEAIPDADKETALQGFNVTRFDDLGFEELLRFVYTFQKPIEDQDHPANVEPPPPPEEGRKATRGGRTRK